MEIFRKLAFWRRRPDFDAGLDDEIRFHLEERADALERGGLSRPAALLQARREFGGVARVAEETRAAWQFPWLEDLFADLRYAARALRREPAFLSVAVLSLALGIGVNTAIFSLTMEALMSTPSARNPSELVWARLGGSSHIGPAQLRFVQDAKVFPGVAGLREDGDINWRRGDETQRLFAMRATDNLFAMAGIPVYLGRGLQAGDQDAVVITHRLWRGKLGSDPGIIGRTLILDGRPHIVVGLLPENHRTLMGLGLDPDLYAPAINNDSLQLYLRLPPNTTPAAAYQRLHAVAASLDQAMPARDFHYANDLRLTRVTGLERLTAEREVSLFFAMLMFVVTLLLGIACLNVSGLLLARASSRAQEFAVRASLGAGQGRLLRQLLTESLLLALAGTVAGLLLNLALTRFISGLTLENLPLPIAFRISPDWRLLGYASAIATASAVFVGLVPAWRASRAKAGDALKQGERQVSGKLTLRRVLVVAQVATSILVLTTAILFARNLLRSVSINPGFDLNQTLYVSLRLVPDRYPNAPGRNALAAQAGDLLRATPGVVSAATTGMIPFNDDSTYGGNLYVDTSASPVRMRRHVNRVGPGYFRTLGVPVLAGREFVKDGEEGAIVNESFARLAFGDVPPVGHTFRYGDTTQTIIGVVRDSKYAWFSDHQRPASFTSYSMGAGASNEAILRFMVRAGVHPESLVRPLRRRMLDVDPSMAVEVKPMRRATGMALLPSRVGAGLLGAMGALGLALTGIGLYGLLSYSVARRIREIGLRMALGAGAGSIRRLIFSEGAWLVGLGLAVGLLASALLTRPLAQFLVDGLTNTDPLTYAAVTALMLLAGATACAVPARRALRIHPLEALRYE
ncbi:MAG: ADOP family duplicated permease [Bryobacteraceae bacterium]|nr:ADOP family duplicated permease [Bryobacteraceae bacterium]